MAQEQERYDVLIVGGGPGGYTAALYCARAGLRTAVLEQLSEGGQMALTTQIDNYPGFDEGVDGFELGTRMRRGAERFGAQTHLVQVQSLELEGPYKRAHTDAGVFEGRALILATGATPRPLGLEKEESLVGRGVHHCASCDGMAYRGKRVAVIGGGNTAVQDALILARICKEVLLVHRRDTLRAAKVTTAQLEHMPNVTFYWDSTVAALLHDGTFRGITLENVKTHQLQDVPCDGVFVSIGRDPATALVQGKLALDAGGYIAADESTRTSVPGVFAVGDVRTKAVRQVITAASDGAVAAHAVEEYLAGSGG